MITLRNGQIALGDCLDVMRSVPSASVDMILCDLPYGTTACSWDNVIPFAPLWSEYWRIVKPNAAIVLTAAQPFTSALVMSCPDRFKYSLVWQKSKVSNFAQAPYRFLGEHEDICIFSKAGCAKNASNRMTFNAQGLIDVEIIKKGLDHNHSNHRPNRKKQEQYTQNKTGYPKSILTFGSEQGIHPTQKPVALFEYLIRTYTNEGETVLDNCLGSGTTAIAAENTDRRWIGIERDPTYFSAACDRIAKHVIAGVS